MGWRRLFLFANSSCWSKIVQSLGKFHIFWSRLILVGWEIIISYYKSYCLCRDLSSLVEDSRMWNVENVEKFWKWTPFFTTKYNFKLYYRIIERSKMIKMVTNVSYCVKWNGIHSDAIDFKRNESPVKNETFTVIFTCTNWHLYSYDVPSLPETVLWVTFPA